MGYLGWLGSSSATLKQALFAIKDAHKKGGAGDPTSGMHRLWILTNAMDRQAVRRPRRLGVTPGMLVWIGKKMIEPLEAEKTTPAWADCVVVVAALTTAWFFMLRAREFSDSGGVDEESVVRGCDLKFSKEGELASRGDADEVTLQFRTDQLAFGESKTLKATGKRFLCPVEALERMRGTWPQRFSATSGEGKRPLFRWASGAVLKRTEVQLLLQRAAQGVGLPPERFLSHSLRIGGATALYQATADIELVKRMGRWSSSTVQRYLYTTEGTPSRRFPNRWRPSRATCTTRRGGEGTLKGGGEEATRVAMWQPFRAATAQTAKMARFHNSWARAQGSMIDALRRKRSFETLRCGAA